MIKTNRNWLPAYCNQDWFIPKVQETRVLFSRRPYFFPDFVGKAISFLQTDDAHKMGFHFDPHSMLPCKWKCSDESLFLVDLSLFAYTGLYPFDKGSIGGYFNESSLAAAVHHGSINLDFGGSHVGYTPGSEGGSFGYIWRPQRKEHSTGCGHLMSVVEPFKEVYQDACENILLYSPTGEKVLISIPNEYLQPNWSSHNIKLLVDLQTLTAGEVEYQENTPFTHTPIARSLFYVHPNFLDELKTEEARPFWSNQLTPIGRYLTPPYFSIFDADAKLDEQGLPQQRLLLYMKYIVAAKHSPAALKACIINTNLEHNRLTDAIRSEAFLPYTFASFTGIFIDIFDQEANNYFTLFQPIGLTVKPRGQRREVDLTPEEIHYRFDQLAPSAPKVDVEKLIGLASPERIVDQFSYKPGYFREFEGKD
jgi:hypothetical protein